MLDFNSYWILFVQAIKYCISTYCYVILCKLLPLENGSERCWLDCSLLQFSPIFKYLSQWKYRKSSMSNGSSQRYKRGKWMLSNKAMRKNGKNPNGKNNWFLKYIWFLFEKYYYYFILAYEILKSIENPHEDSKRSRNISRLPIPKRDERLIIWEVEEKIPPIQNQ